MTRPVPGWREGAPERLYVLAGRPAPPSGGAAALDLVTLIVARAAPQAAGRPEQAAALRLCHHPLSVAEISAHLELPVSTVSVLLADLLADGRAEARAPVPAAELPDTELLEAVVHGLRNL
ncbi:DUF742 domain-containing protein [Streptomyces zingiberis]|uniref:DUF742 domain-containing protein n=1 Tax=Streptomyces zingiberis TaxID=2053010 RepID=A0ABX1C4U4_9ACTN|nr:DUF742 domain-containing protein [Streptomyces zingiberis]NJQ02664.1 DUF742 domain-containing protein [Streptomyces zingiberis]